MSNSVKKGRIYGLLFGGIGMAVAYLEVYIFIGVPPTFSTLSILILVGTFAFFSSLFGGRASKRIHVNGKNEFLEGALSSIYTILSTAPISTYLILIVNDNMKDIYFNDLFGLMLVIEMCTFIVGGIPAVLIGMWFGHFLKQRGK